MEIKLKKFGIAPAFYMKHSHNLLHFCHLGKICPKLFIEQRDIKKYTKFQLIYWSIYESVAQFL